MVSLLFLLVRSQFTAFYDRPRGSKYRADILGYGTARDDDGVYTTYRVQVTRLPASVDEGAGESHGWGNSPTCVCACACACACVCVFVCVCLCVHVYVYAYAYVYVYVCVHVYMCTCIHVYIKNINILPCDNVNM